MKSQKEIEELENQLLKLENLHASFDYLKITIASPTRIRNWADRILPNGEIVGEVTKPETISFRTHQPETGGLFCEKIFGPIKNWKCKCGQYNGFILDKVCETCLVEITEARVRRYRMGYIELTCPVTHLWYLRGIPNYLCILLRCFDPELTATHIEDVVYFKEGERIITPSNPLYRFFFPESQKKKNELIKFTARNLRSSRFQKRLGGEIIKAALEAIDLNYEIKLARSVIQSNSSRNLNSTYNLDKTLIRRIRILESFLATKTNPSWMVLTTLPILPPNLRPLVELDQTRLVAADVNEIYRLIITRNQRLHDFIHHFIAPDLITVHARKLLQEGVDSLIDNARLPKEKALFLNNKPLKSLTEILEGKQGRFRQSLLGKRVDYSARSVIIVGPTLRLNQCGLPYDMATELFQPFLINQLLKTKIKEPSHNTKLAQLMIKKNKPFIWRLLSILTNKYSVLLNRAPTLHRFGIQAFDPIIILGQAIHLHPLVCTGFNADFDGDQMAVHLPLYESSQLEARKMMRPCYNVLSPSNGDVILKPTQDMVIGSYYLTILFSNSNFFVEKWFSNENDALSSFYQKKLNLHSPILVRYPVNNFSVQAEKGKFLFFDKKSNLDFLTQEIFIHNIFNLNSKIYLLTNIGILIGYKLMNNNYLLTDLFLETTPGRLIFSKNFKNSLH
uniref:DNA-directed RNA polymerase subunit n=1 Tax=Neotessella volvocina TaxID=52559 RepID=A0A3G2QZT0_9STRA|nr:RNA polymerase beta' subunit [Neotessella volvocina]